MNQTCRNLTQDDAPVNGGLICHWYKEQKSQYCAVRCNDGYDFLDAANNHESCGSHTKYRWSHEERGEKLSDCVGETSSEYLNCHVCFTIISEEIFPGVRLEADTF